MMESTPAVFQYGKCPCCNKIITVPSGTNKMYCCYCGSQFLSAAALTLYGVKEKAEITSNYKPELASRVTKEPKEPIIMRPLPEPAAVPRMMGVTQLAKTSGVSTSAIRKLVREGKIHAFYTGNKILINYAKFCELLDSME